MTFGIISGVRFSKPFETGNSWPLAESEIRSEPTLLADRRSWARTDNTFRCTLEIVRRH